MSRKTTRKKPAPKAQPGDVNVVTAAVTPEKEPVIKTTLSEVMDACDFAQNVGERIGKLQGFQSGVEQGRHMPRTAGEQRVFDQKPAVANILQEVFEEVQKALLKHGPQSSPHEGYAVLQEEVDELWDEIKADRGRMKSARGEAIQAAAMAVRYVLDNDPH